MTEEENEALKRLENTTKIIEGSSKQLDEELKQVDKCFDVLLSKAKPEDRAKAERIAKQANVLLAKLKAGADVNDIVKQINNLAQ